jgi:hypothetical protein
MAESYCTRFGACGKALTSTQLNARLAILGASRLVFIGIGQLFVFLPNVSFLEIESAYRDDRVVEVLLAGNSRFGIGVFFAQHIDKLLDFHGRKATPGFYGVSIISAAIILGNMMDKIIATAEDQRILEEVNKTPVSNDEMVEVVQEIAAMEPEERGFEGNMVTIARLHHHNPDKGQAIFFRLQALARFLMEEGATGWTVQLTNGTTLTSEPMFTAAGVHPLTVRDGEFTFERESFLQKILEVADLEQVG